MSEVVLLVGAGGVAHPAAIALAAAGVSRLVVCDDDTVELTNLHRQILFGDADVGRDKLEVLAERLAARAQAMEVQLRRTRFRPDTALELLRGVDVVVDACDNFATRFLVADAAHLAGVPSVHGAAVRWTATAMASPPTGRPCYRCLFEDLPEGDAPDCATAGVAGPVCGVAGALAADLALRALRGGASPFGRIVTFDGLTDRLRAVTVRARAGCSLCDRGAAPLDLDPLRYVGASCAAATDHPSARA